MTAIRYGGNKFVYRGMKWPMRTVTLTTRQMVNAELYKAALELGRSFTLCRVTSNYPARVILYSDTVTRNRDFDRHRQPGEDVPDTVQFEGLGILGFNNFDLTHLPKNPYNRQFLIKPTEWQPVRISGPDKSWPVLIEARAGNSKHKINFEINFYIEEN